MRRISAWTACLLWIVIGPSLFSAERLLISDDSDAEEWFISQPSSGAGPTAPARGTPSPDAARAEATRSTRSSTRSSYARLARAPNMFGDSFGNAGQLAETAVVLFFPQRGGSVAVCPCGDGNFTDLPAVGGPVFKVAENNKPIPIDRVYFVYNGVHHALTAGQPASDSQVDRYTVGIEKTFFDGLWSVNVAMPITDNPTLNSGAYSVSANQSGNLAVFFKRLMYADDEIAMSSGLGFSLPTGSDLFIQSRQLNPIRGQIDTQDLVIHNEAVHLVPFVGLLSASSDPWFFQQFLSLDFAAGGNTIDLGTPARTIGTLTPQNLLHVDFSAGRWFYDDPAANSLTRVAAVAEMHYTAAIQNSDTIPIPAARDQEPYINGEFRNRSKRTGIPNLTAGLHFQFGELTNLRVACVVPLQDQPSRQFDSEIQISFNREF